MRSTKKMLYAQIINWNLLFYLSREKWKTPFNVFSLQWTCLRISFIFPSKVVFEKVSESFAPFRGDLRTFLIIIFETSITNSNYCRERVDKEKCIPSLTATSYIWASVGGLRDELASSLTSLSTSSESCAETSY